MDILFFLNSGLFGVGLAMDAFSVSLANGMNEPKMKWKRQLLIAGTFAVFQIIMPLIGYLCVHTVMEILTWFEKLIPWIALLLLLFIGGKMLIEGIRNRDSEAEKPAVTFGELIVQGIATSIDALSVGFTIAGLDVFPAVVESLIIGLVTLVICIGGLHLGKKVGTKLQNKAAILGGIILICIGIEIFIKGVFFS